MFDRATFVAVTPGDTHHYHTTHEHRAPTDESVRLLKEMERAALDKIMATVRLEGSPVDCYVAQARQMMTGDYDFYVRYKLGSETRELKHTYRPGFELSASDERVRCTQELRDVLAKDIANGLLLKPMQRLMGGKFPQFP
jgi:hypothetical protein